MLLPAGVDTVKGPQGGAAALDPAAVRLQSMTTAGASQVEAFLRGIDPAPVPELTLKAGDFRVVDLAGDGRPELLVALDYSGRAFYNTLAIVWANGSKFRLQKLDIWNLTSMKGVVQDLDGDGRKELVLPEQVTAYQGSGAMASWHAVYMLGNQGRYVERSANFRSFYETKELPAIESRILEAKGNPDGLEPNEATHRVQALEIERDKVLRVIGQDPKAGLSTAVDWAKSSDRVTRLLALGVLEDIDDPMAARALQNLSLDPDPMVKVQAQSAIEAQKLHLKRYP
jgi:hypothetical protein